MTMSMSINVETVIAGSAVIISAISLLQSKKAQASSDSTHLENRIATLEERSISESNRMTIITEEHRELRSSIVEMTKILSRLDGKVDVLINDTGSE